MLLLSIFGPFGKKGGNSWFHAAILENQVFVEFPFFLFHLALLKMFCSHQIN